MKVQEQETVVKAASDLVCALPIAAKIEVLNHLIVQLGDTNLTGLSRESRELLLRALPTSEKPAGVSSTALLALHIAPHKLCSLEVIGTHLGRDVTFVVPEGMSGRQILDEIEKANPRGKGDGVVCAGSGLLCDDELDTVANSDVLVKLSVCFTFNSLTRSEQYDQLEENYLEFAPRWAVTLAAALYRDANGFPADRSDIGTSNDKGDLFQGLWVRAETGTFYTDQDGLGACGFRDGRRSRGVAAVGSPVVN